MASQLPGYEYDVFISYRHNDNKTLSTKSGHIGTGDGWVSEFVANLQLELEATVKGKVTIYFDENPHDGLLETHIVDASLAHKIRSLIFIPIISQTYCDPDSFAWQSEFLAFNKMTSEDKFGPIIRLHNGNATSRVLPVRIHELDDADIKMLENELKERIRPIDFIFKAPGVNRPLRIKEEDPLKNTNKTIYRDQVNKTANAIKDIINGMKHFGSAAVSGTEEKKKTIPTILSPSDLKITSIKSIAVLPFSNTGTEAGLDFLGEGLAEEVLLSLSKIRDLRVTPRLLAFRHNEEQHNPGSVMKSLSVTSVVQGSFQKTKETLKVSITVTTSEDGSGGWSNDYDCSLSELFSLPSKITTDIVEALRIPVQKSERISLSKKITTSGAAYESYLKGRFYRNLGNTDLHKGLQCFQEAVGMDPLFARANAGVAEAYALLSFQELIPFQDGVQKSKKAVTIALEADPSLVEAYSILAFISMCYELNWPEVEHFFSKVFSINPANPKAEEKYTTLLKQIMISFNAFESEPLNTVPYFLSAYALLHLGKFDDALVKAQEAVKRDPNSFMAHRALGLSYLGLENFELSIQSLEAAATLSNRHQWLLFELMGAYAQAGKRDEAQAIIDETMERANILPARIYNFFFPH